MSISSKAIVDAANDEKTRVTATTIIVVGTYFGRWPVWFPAFLLSCARNEMIDWLFFTDCAIPQVDYPNIKFEQMSLAQLNHLATQKLGFPVHKAAYSQVDLQPTYGILFQEYIESYDFWGHCDFDVIWGNVRDFISEDVLQNYDVVSCRKDFLAGHLTLWRNEHRINNLFRSIPSHRDILSSREYFNFDEAIISTFIKNLILSGSKLRVYWPKQMVFWFRGDVSPSGWRWENGRVFDAHNSEHIYLHFQAAKRFVTCIDFQVGEQPEMFTFDQHGIQTHQPSLLSRLDDGYSRNKPKSSYRKIVDKTLHFLRLVKKYWGVRDVYWANKLMETSISPRDVHYDRKSGRLFLEGLNLLIEEQQSFILEGYHVALQLVTHQNGKFYQDEQGELFVQVADLIASIQNSDDLLALKGLFVDGIYNIKFLHPTVVLDIGMHVGLSSLFFANQPQVIVIGYEPFQKTFDQAMRNITFNPAHVDKIQAIRVGIGATGFKTIAGHLPGMLERSGNAAYLEDNAAVPKFEYEEVQIEDIADVVETIATGFPGRKIAIKIDLEQAEYYIDGITEYSIIDRLFTTGKLNLIDTIMLKWHKHNNDITSLTLQLCDAGFSVLILRPNNVHDSMLYAFRVST